MIDQRLVAIALDAVDTTNFEKFAQTFYGAIQDREFVPLGGVHDGGAEGFDANGATDLELFTDESASTFLQVSKQISTRKKIRDTVRRLREYGRNPRVLTYITSQIVKDIDREERALSDELGCRIAIRDANYIEIYINSSSMTQGAFVSYLEPAVSRKFNPGESEIGSEVSKYVDRTLAVFLRQEIDSRKSRSSLIESVSDSLIMWALRETGSDPRNPNPIHRDEILARIEAALPSSKSFVRGVLDHRLRVLASKNAPGGRHIRVYAKTNEYSLPYETRLIVASENADDDLLKMRVSCIFEDRISWSTNEDIDRYRPVILEVCHKALEQAFERQGLNIAQFAIDSDVDDEMFIDIASIATGIIDKLHISGDAKSLVRRFCIKILRGTFYRSTDVERRYLGKLSRTYVLLMLLRSEPNIVNYFGKMAGHFNLYIGSDIIIRALSELYLDQESQTTINLLRILKDAGSTLILTEITVEEVVTHVHAQMLEFENVYASNEHMLSQEMVQYVDRLLIRAYFYAKLSPVPNISAPKTWRHYIGSFCDYRDVRSKRGDKEFADYLINKFGFVYEPTTSTKTGLDENDIESLTKSILEVKREAGSTKERAELLAYNDAIQILRVYGKRSESNESSPGNPFGFKTWWLTQDGKVRRGARELVKSKGGKRFMMRPELLLNYISVTPTMEDVQDTYKSVFPSILGVRLSAGIADEEFHKVLRDANEMRAYDDARADALVTSMTAKLTNDGTKQFDVTW